MQRAADSAAIAIGVIDLSNAFSRKLALEQGAQRAIEKIMQTTADTNVQARLTNEALCQVNGTNTDATCKTSSMTASNVTVSHRLECTDSAGTTTSRTSADAITFDSYLCLPSDTKHGRYIQIALTDNYQAMFPVNFYGFTSGGYPITATAGMRTK